MLPVRLLLRNQLLTRLRTAWLEHRAGCRPLWPMLTELPNLLPSRCLCGPVAAPAAILLLACMHGLHAAASQLTFLPRRSFKTTSIIAAERGKPCCCCPLSLGGGSPCARSWVSSSDDAPTGCRCSSVQLLWCFDAARWPSEAGDNRRHKCDWCARWLCRCGNTFIFR